MIYPVIYLLQVCVGYHKKGYPDQSNKKSQKAKQAPTRSPVRRPQSIYILNLEPKTRLARPPRARTQTPPRPTPWASGVSSVSPDPSRARAPTPLHPVRTRLPTHGVRTHDVTGAVTPISQQGMVATIPTTLVTVALPLPLCNLTSFTVVYCLTVKEEWGRLTSVTVCCLLPLLTGRSAVSPIRPP